MNEPCGTPELTLVLEEEIPSRTTQCVLCERKLFIQSIVSPVTPYHFSLSVSVMCATVVESFGEIQQHRQQFDGPTACCNTYLVYI